MFSLPCKTAHIARNPGEWRFSGLACRYSTVSEVVKAKSSLRFPPQVPVQGACLLGLQESKTA